MVMVMVWVWVQIRRKISDFVSKHVCVCVITTSNLEHTLIFLKYMVNEHVFMKLISLN